MTQLELIDKLTDEQKRLHEYLEENDRRVYLFEQCDEMCAEVENWTDGGVDMIMTLMPFTIQALQDFYDDFDVDEQIDLYRQDERYRNTFTISRSLKDFEDWENELENLIINYYKYDTGKN